MTRSKKAENNKKIRVLVVDDHAITRNGIKTLLSVYGDMDFIGEAPNGKEAIEICKKLKPDIVLMDLDMPVMDGVAATKSIKTDDPDVKVIALTSFAGKKLVSEAIKAGITSYIIKNISPEIIVQTIRDAHAGKSNLSPEATMAVIEEIKEPSAAEFNLTKQELNILNLIAKGCSNKEISKELYVSPHTVKFHISNILSKLGASSRTEAAAIATRKNLVN